MNLLVLDVTEQVEAQIVKVSEVVNFFWVPLSPPRAGDHPGGRPDGPGGSESLEVSKVHQVQMEHQDRQRILANGQLVSSPPSFSGVMI